MDSTPTKLWNFYFISAWFANFLMGISFYLLIPTLPFYLVDKFAANKELVGIIMSCYVIAALLIRPFSGYILDTFDRKPVYIAAFVLFVASTAGYLAVASVTFMLILRFWHGLTWGVITTAGNTLSIDVVPAEQRGEGIGFYGLSLTLSMAIGPMVGLMMYDVYDFNVIFYTSLVIGLLGLVFATLIKVPKRVHVIHPPISLDRFLLIKGLITGVNLIFISLTYGMILSFSAMYGKESGVTNAGLFFTLLAVGMAISRLLTSKMFDKGKLKLAVGLGSLALILGFAIFTVCHSPILYFLAAFVMGIGYGILSPAFQVMFIHLGTHNQRGTANSTFLTAFDVGVGGGMLLAGTLATHWSLTVAFGVSTVAAFISLMFFLKIAYPYYFKHKINQ